jgi:hypothetical protein
MSVIDRIPFAHGPSELVPKYRRRMPEVGLHPHFVQKIQRRRVVDHEDVDLPLLRRLDDRLVAWKLDHRRDPGRLESVDVLIPRLDPEGKSFQRRDVPDPGNVVAKVDRRFDRGIGRSEIKVVPALGRLDDAVDDVELAGAHAPQRLAPVHHVDLGLDPCLPFPHVPLIDQDALHRSFVRAKHEGRIDVVHHDPDRSRRLDGRRLRRDAGRNPCERKNHGKPHGGPSSNADHGLPTIGGSGPYARSCRARLTSRSRAVRGAKRSRRAVMYHAPL